MKEIEGPFLNSEKACKYLGVSLPTLYRLLKRRARLPGHRVGGTWRFLPDELERWVRENRR